MPGMTSSSAAVVRHAVARHVASDAPARPHLSARRLRSRKDTAIALPKKKLSVSFDADNPGQWMPHCHDAYHGEAGMMATVAYRA
ncbi:FtsP/CotA-like multicopper oxidase with cupredoxin domain [Streptomyces afghaniensis]|nr:FtsP/CotA-like multicopper oxidase with cupredoxin domain [Streptomyces afghaniensis]